MMEALATPALRLAVLPAADAAADGHDEGAYFSHGFLEDLITDLSRFPNLGLISSHSSFAKHLRELDDRQVALQLNADLLLKMNVRKWRDGIRINAQLVDPGDGGVLWAERYDTSPDAVFDLQDKLVERVTSALSKQIDAATLDAARRKPITDLEAYDCWLRGLEKLREGSREADERARELFERALEIDPHYARAYVGLSLSHFNEWSCQQWELSEASECLAYQYANRAFQLDRNDSVAHLVLGRVFLFRHEFGQAKEHMDRAFELNPNDADHLVQIASCYAFLGEPDNAAKLFERALELNPYCDPWYFAYGGFIQIVRRNYEEGIAMALKAPLTTVWIDLAGFVALAHAHRGDLDEAAVYAKIFLEAFQEKITNGRQPEPGEAHAWLRRVNPFKRQEDTEFYVEGLRNAGIRDEPGADAPPAPTPETSNTSPVFRVEGQLRVAVFEGARIELPEVKGYRDIELLLHSAGEEVHCSELMGAVAEKGARDDVIDARARSEYATRIRELQADLQEAESANDLARAEKIHEELDPLIDHLAKSVGLGGRSRKVVTPVERARSAVTWRIRSAIRKLEAAHPTLGRHFTHSIRTGTFCSYAPEKPVDWAI